MLVAVDSTSPVHRDANLLREPKRVSDFLEGNLPEVNLCSLSLQPDLGLRSQKIGAQAKDL